MKDIKTEIETGVPIPTSRAHLVGRTATMRAMQKGDSFVAPRESRSAIYSTAKYLGISVTVRVQEDGRLRAWRTA